MASRVLPMDCCTMYMRDQQVSGWTENTDSEIVAVCWGVFSHSARTARAQRAHSANYYGDYPGNNPENHQSIQNSKIQTSDACHGSQGPKFCPL